MAANKVGRHLTRTHGAYVDFAAKTTHIDPHAAFHAALFAGMASGVASLLDESETKMRDLLKALDHIVECENHISLCMDCGDAQKAIDAANVFLNKTY